jgi:hypothetical protein
VDGGERRARQLELAARLQADVRAVLARQRDDRAALLDRRPAEPGQAAEQRADAARTLVGDRAVVVEPEGELLVLGADPPALGGLETLLDPGGELPAVRDRLAARARWGRHGVLTPPDRGEGGCP